MKSADKILNRVLYGVDVPIFSTDGRVLMLRRSVAGEAFRTGWEYVKGGLRPDESFVEAALREANEEAGDLGYMLIAELPDEYTVDARYRNSQDYDFVHKRAVVLRASQLEVRLDSNEHADYEWMTPEKAIEVIWVEEGKKILAKASAAYASFIADKRL